jgi:hypothetical protein
MRTRISLREGAIQRSRRHRLRPRRGGHRRCARPGWRPRHQHRHRGRRDSARLPAGGRRRPAGRCHQPRRPVPPADALVPSADLQGAHRAPPALSLAIQQLPRQLRSTVHTPPRPQVRDCRIQPTDLRRELSRGTISLNFTRSGACWRLEHIVGHACRPSSRQRCDR